MTDAPNIRYTRSGDIEIAYQVIGDGPVDVVHVSGFVSHGDMLWDLPFQASTVRELADFSRLVLFDKRGTGLSERTLGFGSAADRMDDIRAVMDEVGIGRAAIHGVSEGGPLALVFAATYPDRVTKLVLQGTYARALWAPDFPIGRTREEYDELLALAKPLWGTGHVVRTFVQNAPDEALPLLARFERSACTPTLVDQIMRCNIEIDVRSVLPAIACPTLIVHCTADPIFPIEHARYLAEHIPGARLVEVDGPFHVEWSGAHRSPLVREFLLGEDAPQRIDRVLATVLFTDIVSSTEREAAVGDRRWRELLDVHDQAARSHVARFSGRVVKTTGDGILATFDGPGRAIACAIELTRTMRTFGVDLRAGLHTGEIELRGTDVAGLGVVIARRVCDLAGAGQVVASRTVRDLVIGSDVVFVDRGTHALKGLADEWQLYGVG